MLERFPACVTVRRGYKGRLPRDGLCASLRFGWTGGRVVEGARLERVYRGNSIEGSNPSLSAIYEKRLPSGSLFS